MSPTDDRDIRAALSRDPYPSGATRLSTDAEGAVVPSLDGQPDPLREAAQSVWEVIDWLDSHTHPANLSTPNLDAAGIAAARKKLVAVMAALEDR